MIFLSFPNLLYLLPYKSYVIFPLIMYEFLLLLLLLALCRWVIWDLGRFSTNAFWNNFLFKKHFLRNTLSDSHFEVGWEPGLKRVRLDYMWILNFNMWVVQAKLDTKDYNGNSCSVFWRTKTMLLTVRCPVASCFCTVKLRELP